MRRRALVVDADPETQKTCRQVLEGAGFSVDTVDSGIAAVVAARRAQPDVIFAALQLRDVPGRDAVQWLRSNPALKATPIVVLTTDAEIDVDVTAMRPGASLRKPLSAGTIRRIIQAVLK